MVNAFEPAAQVSVTRRALGIALANSDADAVARLASCCRALRDDARCAPRLIFGPESAIWRVGAAADGDGDDDAGSGDENENENENLRAESRGPDAPRSASAGLASKAGAPLSADDVLIAVVTRHRPGRLRRLVLAPPPPGPLVTSRAVETGPTFVGLLPATVQFCWEVQSNLTCVWAEPGALRPNPEGHTAAARGVIPVDSDAARVLCTRGACSQVPVAAHRVGVFAPNVVKLALGAAAKMEDDALRAILRACASLRSLEITDAADALRGDAWGRADAADAPAEVPALERLRLARCRGLRAVRVRAPKLEVFSATDCDALERLDVGGDAGGRPAESEAGRARDLSPLPAMRAVVLGRFTPGSSNAPADALEKSSVRENSSLASELAALVRRCPRLERLSVPASAAPGSEAEAVEEWSDVLASSCAGTLKRLCFQRPVTPTGLLLLVAGAQAQALEAVFVAALCVAAPGAARVGGAPAASSLPPTEANAVADDIAGVVAMCPELTALTFVDPGPRAEAGAAETRARCAASAELARGALLGRCRVAEEEAPGRAPLATDIARDFAGEAAAVRLGTADARCEGGLSEILRECDECEDA
jgi:hypothetical protein